MSIIIYFFIQIVEFCTTSCTLHDNVARAMHAYHHFLFSFSQMLSHVLYYTPCSSTLFSGAPEKLVSRDVLGSPVPRQFFFVPSEIGSARVRAIRSRAERLFLVRA